MTLTSVIVKFELKPGGGLAKGPEPGPGIGSGASCESVSVLTARRFFPGPPLKFELELFTGMGF